ncbi:BnaC06g13360D [Brassica napus]|uniref:(rape) hypothetical protein n=1 Tax=Brassica napus TaxID=3708 RepID=A0A078FI15_BRANA|nr:unnamed protein product [Brassica napus]CDY11728.1 BnaC06g13360D [Brassica napus]
MRCNRSVRENYIFLLFRLTYIFYKIWFDSHIFETDEPVGSEPSDGAFKFQISSPSGNRSHFVVMDELGLPSRMFETGFKPMEKKRVNNYFNLRWIELIKSALDDDQLAQLNASQFLI